MRILSDYYEEASSSSVAIKEVYIASMEQHIMATSTSIRVTVEAWFLAQAQKDFPHRLEISSCALEQHISRLHSMLSACQRKIHAFTTCQVTLADRETLF